MNTTLNWLLTGTGDIAKKRVAPALTAVSGSRIEAVCDISIERGRALGSLYGAEKVYTDYETALKDSAVNAVYIATPIYLHVPMSVKAIEAGKHVLVEKPLGLSEKDVQEAVKAESQSTIACACAYFRRFYPRYEMLKNMLESGEFGKIVLIRMTYFSWFDPRPGDPGFWRVDPEKSGGGPISDMGSHMFDVLIGLFGLPATVSAMTCISNRTWKVEDSSAMSMRMNDGALVTASFHWNSKTWVHMFEVVGTEAKILWQPYDSGPVVKTVGREITEIDLPNANNVHEPLIEDFVNAVRMKRPPAITFSEAAKTNRLMDAVYRSSHEKREVDV